MVGSQFKQILDSKGKLNQIYRTRRSGAANNAKDWLRSWLDLDNEVLIAMRLEEDKRRLKAEVEKERRERGVEGGTTEGDTGDHAIYDDVKRAEFISNVDELWNNLKDEDDDVFYRESLNYVKRELGNGSFIEAMYLHFRKNNPYADSYELRDFLKDLFGDPNNY